MRTAELLTAMASWLESPHNEAMLLAEDNEQSLKVVAETCILAAQLIKAAAEEVDQLEGPEPSLITPETIAETAALAQAFDNTDDPALKKMASVLDELLLTIAAPKDELANSKAKEGARIEELRKRYEQPRKDLRAQQRTDQAEKDIDKSGFTKEYKIESHPLQTRNCPEHFCQMSRVGDHLYICNLDHKQYDYSTGYTLENGEHVPGSDVALQSGNGEYPNFALFDTREGRLNYHQ